MDTPIDERVRAELKRRRGDWTAIHKKAGVSHSWLSKFVNEKIPNPGIETLRDVERALEAVPPRIGADAQEA